MSSLLARWGQFEGRLAAQAKWSSVKRKRRNRACADCITREALKQCQNYGNNTSPPKVQKSGEAVKTGREHNLVARAIRRRSWASCPAERSDLFARRYAHESCADRKPKEAGLPRTLLQGDLRDVAQIREQEHDQLKTWEEFELGSEEFRTKDENAFFEQDVGGIDDEPPSVEQSSMLDIDYRNHLQQALIRGEVDLVARCLFAAFRANDLDFIRSIPSTSFSDILRLLRPSNFISKLGNAHLELSAGLVQQLGITPMHQVAFEHSNVIRKVVGIRRAAGVRLTYSDYVVLLQSARDLGNQKMGWAMWRSMMSDGHVPDTACFNHVMSAVVWNNVHSAGPRHKVRVIPFNMLQRSKPKTGSSFSNYRVGPGGVREQTMSIFNQMLANGAAADEESFRILMTACAREGDVSTVKSVLKKVWSIDVDAILGGRSGASNVPQDVPLHSSLRPTSGLLFTIAHAFGINNNIPAALRTVDFVAKHYELVITDDIWAQLLEWTFVLSVDRHGKAEDSGSKSGQLPKSSVLSLWETMTGAPYHVQPTMGMYNYLIKNLFYRHWPTRFVEFMKDGRALHNIHAADAHAAWRKLVDNTTRSVQGQAHLPLEPLRQSWEYAELIRRRDAFWLHRWLRLLLGSSTHWSRIDQINQYYARQLPALLWEWRPWTPTKITYEVPGGLVEIEVRTNREMMRTAQSRLKHWTARRETLKHSRRYIGEDWFDNGRIRVTNRLKAARRRESRNNSARSSQKLQTEQPLPEEV